MNNLESYLTKLKEALDSSFTGKSMEGYLDLASVEIPFSAGHLRHMKVPPDTLVSFLELVMREIEKCNADKIEIGVNELLKHFLITLDRDNEDFLAERYLKCLKMIFKRSLLPDFPFPDEVWNYICACLRSTGIYLLDKQFFTATREVIDFLAGMGRIAALKGLPTANTQSSLRMLENKALAQGEKPLASIAKNARFNLET